ncbi:MAG: hypothetical protein SCM11_16115 [Bacillota bacterium]|nr:hypothetical protein [Bacillota bacterium]
MSLAIFPDNKLGLHYFSILNGNFVAKLYGDTIKSVDEKNVILCIEDTDLLKIAICNGKNVLYPFPLLCCVEEIAGLLSHHNAYLLAGGIEDIIMTGWILTRSYTMGVLVLLAYPI